MPWSGSGAAIRETPVSTGSTAWADSVADGDTVITDAFHDFHDQDIANMLDNCVTRDGQNAPTQNLPMGNFKHTGVGNATARNQYVAAGQLQDGGLDFATTASVTSGAYVATLSPAITVYVEGADYRIRFAQDCGAFPPFLALNGLTSLAVYAPNSQALGQNAIKAGTEAIVRYVSSLPGLVLVVPNVPILLEAGISTSIASFQVLRNLTGFRSFLLKFNELNAVSGAGSVLEFTIKAGGSFLGSGYTGATEYGDLNAGTVTYVGAAGGGAYFPVTVDNVVSANGRIEIEIIPPSGAPKNYTAINQIGVVGNNHGLTVNRTYGSQSGTGTVQGVQIIPSGATFISYDYELWGVP